MRRRSRSRSRSRSSNTKKQEGERSYEQVARLRNTVGEQITT